MTVTIFKELWKTDVPYHIPIEKALERIRIGKSKTRIEKIRGGDKKEKEKLPCIVFSGMFRVRNIKGLIEHSGYMVLDYDDVDDVKSLKDELKQNKYVYCVFISPSGNGIKAVVKIPPCDATTHSKYHKAFQEEFESKYFDTSGSDVSRVCFESYDPDIYVNHDVVQYEPVLEDKGYNTTDRIPLVPVTDEDMIIERIMSWNWNRNFVEGERNNYIFDLAGAFCEYGVDEMYAKEFILNHVATDPDFTEHEVNMTVKSAYKRRSFGIRYFEDKSKIDRIKKDLKYPESEVMKKHKIDKDTYDAISKEDEDVEFWEYDEKGKISIDPYKYKLFLEVNGFRKYFPNGVTKPQMVRVNENKVSDTSPDFLKDFVLGYLLDNDKMDVWRYCSKYMNLFSGDFLTIIETIDLMMLQDTKEKSFIAFRNGIVEVTKDSVTLRDYIDVDGFIWENQIIDRDYVPGYDENEYKQFISNISNNEPYPMECAIGYLLSGYKNKMNNKAIILNDEVISENPEGGTGKGLFIQGIRQMKKTAILDGKAFDDKKSFPYQTVSQDTAVLVFDDVKKNFDFESKFSLVTEGLTLERKNKDAIKLTVEESPKLVISTNYAIRGEGNSHDRRRHELEFAQYYNGQNTPYDEFGRLIFDEWSENDFNAFDNYMIGCLQKYLNNGLVDQQANNLKLRKFIAETSMEFYEWAFDTDNINFNIEYEKAELFGQFCMDYPDFKNYLSRKRFNLWMKKFAKFQGWEYTDRKSGNNKYFTLRHPDSDYEPDNTPF
jgi:hypothetical protein